MQLLPFCPPTAFTSDLFVCFKKHYADADEHRKFGLLRSFHKLRVHHTHFSRQAYKTQRYDTVQMSPFFPSPQCI